MMSEDTVVNNAAFVINQIYQMSSSDVPVAPVKKTVQKMIYLIQNAGINLGYDYHLYFYGPYSADLDGDTMNLVSENIITMEYSNWGHKLTPLNNNVSLTDNIDSESVKRIIEHYSDKSWNPRKLELLATAVYAHEHGEGKDMKSVLTKVKKIKGDKYSDREIQDILSEFEFLNIPLEE